MGPNLGAAMVVDSSVLPAYLGWSWPFVKRLILSLKLKSWGWGPPSPLLKAAFHFPDVTVLSRFTSLEKPNGFIEFGCSEKGWIPQGVSLQKLFAVAIVRAIAHAMQ